jgi:hypothetical protein
LVWPCPWLESQQHVRWLQPGHFALHRSFQPPAEVFLLGISLKGTPSYLLGPEDRSFSFLVPIFGETMAKKEMPKPTGEIVPCFFSKEEKYSDFIPIIAGSPLIINKAVIDNLFCF